MPRKRLTKAQGDRLLAETKQRRRLLQEARTSERLEQLEIEACEELGRQLRLEYLQLNGELECPETDTIRQYSIHSIRVKTRKISYRNQKTVLIKNTLSSKAQINSFFLIPHLRNSDTTMSNMQVLGTVRANGATTAAMVQQEPNPANNAEANVDMEVDKNSDDEITSQR
jgi:hypothetical protein